MKFMQARQIITKIILKVIQAQLVVATTRAQPRTSKRAQIQTMLQCNQTAIQAKTALKTTYRMLSEKKAGKHIVRC